MAASKSLTPGQRVLRSRIAAHESWAGTADRTARASKGHKASPASIDYWLTQVDPDGRMTDEARAAAAESKRKAYMTRLALASSKARKAKRGAADAA